MARDGSANLSYPRRVLHVGVMGAGAIGCWVGGTLLAHQTAQVTLVGRKRLAERIAQLGLTVEDLERDRAFMAADVVDYRLEPEALRGCDVVLVCVKSAQTEEVAQILAPIVDDGAVVVSLQNGVRNPAVLRRHLPDVLAGIVEFNVRSSEGVFRRTMDGPIVLEAPARSRRPEIVEALVDALRRSGVEVATHDDIAPAQWTKLLLNSNNAVSALSGAPTPTLLATPGYRRVMATLLDEGVAALRAAGIRPAKLRGLPVGLMPKILRLPTPLVRLVTRAQMKVDAEARSSMWEDLQARRPTEVDFLNGEIVRLARAHGRQAPTHARIVELVHAAEAAGQGSPNLAPDELEAALGLRR